MFYTQYIYCIRYYIENIYTSRITDDIPYMTEDISYIHNIGDIPRVYIYILGFSMFLTILPTGMHPPINTFFLQTLIWIHKKLKTDEKSRNIYKEVRKYTFKS